MSRRNGEDESIAKRHGKRRGVCRGRRRATQTVDDGKQEVACAFLSQPPQHFHTRSHSLADYTELSAVESLTEKSKLGERQAVRFCFVTFDTSVDKKLVASAVFSTLACQDDEMMSLTFLPAEVLLSLALVWSRTESWRK